MKGEGEDSVAALLQERKRKRSQQEKSVAALLQEWKWWRFQQEESVAAVQQEWKWQTFLSKRKLLPPCYKKRKDGKDHIQNAQKFSELLGNRGIPCNINLRHCTKTCLELRLNSCRSPELRCPSLLSKCLVLDLKSKSPVLTWWRFPGSLLVFLLRFIHPPHASLHQRYNKTKSQCSQHGAAQQEWRNGVNITTEKTCHNSGCNSLVSNCLHWCVRATDRLCNL